jgi:hypothetical protein
MGSILPLVLAAAGWGTPAATPESEVDFFEKRIRPVLVEQCYRCHSASAKSVKGGLRLDSRDGIRKGGATAPAVVPGKPEESLLLKAIRYSDDALQMPPKKKLPAAVVADFEAWILRGAADPRDAIPPTRGDDLQAARKHWAFQPIRRPPIPAVAHPEWVSSPVDAFVLKQLGDRGLSPSPRADRRTLLRRVTYDLTGLPPTTEEAEAFEKDKSPDAFARVVDRLLASPHYGERWGRHWLDVARYADTKDGVLMFGDDRVRPFAYTYRDYVIRAFNEDVPFDRFVHEQLAADMIEPKVEPWRLAAMGFLTLGRIFDNNIHDIIDDRIDTVTRGFLGMTVGCARCHDHKYDPIPTKDYYSLYGVFASCEAPLDLPLLGRPEEFAGFEAFEKKAGPKRRELQAFLDSQYAMLLETARQRVGDYLVHAATTPPDPLETAIFFLSLAPTDLRPQITHRWRELLAEHATPDNPVFGPWHDLMQLADSSLAAGALAVLQRWRSRQPGIERGQVNPLVLAALEHATLNSRAAVARAYGELLRDVYERSKKSPQPSGGPSTIEERSRLQLVDLVAGRSSPCFFTRGQTYYYLSRAEKDGFNGKRTELDKIAVQSPEAPPRGMVLQDADPLCDPHVFKRGNPGQQGDAVPRQFLWVLAGNKRQPFPHGSGRLDLAQAITAAENPLTARVIVNRLWMHHFGQPLVDTPNDFGRRSNPPSHPELLDYLAATLQRDGWSLKRLHRLLLLSSTYQQSGQDRPDCRRVDPDNRLLWRMNRRRLDLEAMRDTLLAVSGRLDQRMGGRPANVAGDPRCARRTVYALIDRQDLPGLFRVFDFASPDQSAERRPLTTVPQQALFGLNSPFVLEQARALVAHPTVAGAGSAEAKIDALYRRVLGRLPDLEERRTALRFVAEAAAEEREVEKSQLGAWEQFAQVLLVTNEALFLD